MTSVSLPAGLGLAAAALATLMLGVFPGPVLHLAGRAGWSQIDQPAPHVTTETASTKH